MGAGDLAVGTLRSILDQLQEDVDAWWERLDADDA
jgi:hypothetical protein